MAMNGDYSHRFNQNHVLFSLFIFELTSNLESTTTNGLYLPSFCDLLALFSSTFTTQDYKLYFQFWFQNVLQH